MFGSLGTPEIIIIAVVVVLLFGVGKLSGLGKDLGSSVREFRRAVKDEDEKPQQAQAQVQQPQQPAPPPPPAQPPTGSDQTGAKNIF